jgi:hypothetical protein
VKEKLGTIDNEILWLEWSYEYEKKVKGKLFKMNSSISLDLIKDIKMLFFQGQISDLVIVI